MDRESYPYKGSKSSCKFDASKVKVQVESYQNVELGNEVAMVDYLYNIGPLSAGMHALEL